MHKIIVQTYEVVKMYKSKEEVSFNSLYNYLLK
jgi:hypothetical protein